MEGRGPPGGEGESGGTKTVNYTYTYMLNGEKKSSQTGAQKYFVDSRSGAAIRYGSGGEVKELKNIAGVELTELGIFTVPGDNGAVDFETVFEILARHGYEGWMLVEAEQYLPSPGALDFARMARDYIKKTAGL